MILQQAKENAPQPHAASQRTASQPDTSPLYMQIARKLTDDVRAGRYQVDQALPSERTLSEQLNVSRVTARKAIDQLVEQGLVVRRRGSGNYIAPRIEQPLSDLSSFSEQLQQRGYTPGSRWLKRDIVIASADEQMSLGLSPNTKVARLERLRLADGRAVELTHSYCRSDYYDFVAEMRRD